MLCSIIGRSGAACWDCTQQTDFHCPTDLWGIYRAWFALTPLYTLTKHLLTHWHMHANTCKLYLQLLTPCGHLCEQHGAFLDDFDVTHLEKPLLFCFCSYLCVCVNKMWTNNVFWLTKNGRWEKKGVSVCIWLSDLPMLFSPWWPIWVHSLRSGARRGWLRGLGVSQHLAGAFSPLESLGTPMKTIERDVTEWPLQNFSRMCHSLLHFKIIKWKWSLF